MTINHGEPWARLLSVRSLPLKPDESEDTWQAMQWLLLEQQRCLSEPRCESHKYRGYQ